MGLMESRYRELSSGFVKIGEISPRQMEAWDHFIEADYQEGCISKKYKELIAIALSICARCEWCIAYHVKKALDLGASEEEIIEASWVAVQMGGGPALTHARLVLQSLEEFRGHKKEDMGITDLAKPVEEYMPQYYVYLCSQCAEGVAPGSPNVIEMDRNDWRPMCSCCGTRYATIKKRYNDCEKWNMTLKLFEVQRRRGRVF